MGFDVVILIMRHEEDIYAAHWHIRHDFMGLPIIACRLMARGVEDGPRGWAIGVVIMVPFQICIARRPSMSIMIKNAASVTIAPDVATFR